MNTHAEKTKDDNSKLVDHKVSQKQGSGESTFQFVDNRPEAIVQRKLQETANNSTQVKQAGRLQSITENHSPQQQQPIQKKENNTGLPDNLKTGIENISGYSMDDVKVHRNSDKPAQLQAHAYAQGTDIHLGPGQEKHLPHETWHVVQQKQGRVKPTMQMKGKINVNDDAGLEKEADVMGVKAMQLKANSKFKQISNSKGNSGNTVQRAWQKHPQDDVHLWDEAKDGLAWFYEGDLMMYQIVYEEAVSEEWLDFYRLNEGAEKSYEEWNTLFNGSTTEKKVDVKNAQAAAMHTVGDYKSRNAVISTLTKYDLLTDCVTQNWNIGNLPNSENILSYFKNTYKNITKRTLMDDEVEDRWFNYFDSALPIIKGFKNLGSGDEKHVGTKVNRGDSEGVLMAMGLNERLNALADGTTTSVNWEAKFLGATSTAKGDDPSKNQYAKNGSVIWLLTIAKEHHGFDFQELIGEGYSGEKEITFPMGVMVKVNRVIAHKEETHAALRPHDCNSAKYTIYGEIF